MDPIDYLRLDTFLRRFHVPNDNPHSGPSPRSPIMLVHDVPVQPGWNSVLTVWDATPWGFDNGHSLQIKVATWDYGAHGDREYTMRDVQSAAVAAHAANRPPTVYSPDQEFGLFNDPDIHTFLTIEKAMYHAAANIQTYAEGVGC